MIGFTSCMRIRQGYCRGCWKGYSNHQLCVRCLTHTSSEPPKSRKITNTKKGNWKWNYCNKSNDLAVTQTNTHHNKLFYVWMILFIELLHKLLVWYNICKKNSIRISDLEKLVFSSYVKQKTYIICIECRNIYLWYLKYLKSSTYSTSMRVTTWQIWSTSLVWQS